MTSFRTRWLARAVGLLVIAAFSGSSAASAQIASSGSPSVRGDPGAALSRHLTAIASDPRNLLALKGAGEAALELGDPQAALGFLARAEEISPRDGRIKALMGSALIAMEQVRPALRFFDDAAALGVPEVEIAGDRGLAYDLIGNPRLAQRDYQLALTRTDDPEVRRRLALSLAISGERDAALRTIDAQLRRQDRAAWRVRAFVLALTGDMRGASSAVRAVMAPPVAAAMEPFLARLPSLGPADRAFAVHFGRFPDASGSASTSAAVPPQQDPALASAIAAGAPDPGQAPLGTPALASGGSARSPPSQPTTVAAATALPQPVQPSGEGSGAVVGPEPGAPPPPAAGGPTLHTVSAAQQQPASAISDDPPPTIAAAVLPPSNIAEPADPAAMPRSEPEPARSSFADVAAMITLLPTNEEAPSMQPRSASSAPAPKPAAAKPVPAKPAAAKPAPPKPQSKKPAPPKEPSRIWVQIAGGADKEALPREFARLKAKAPALFAGKTAWTTALRATNRLLVGPFKTDKEARDFVNQLARAQLAGFAWTSEDGQAVERLPAR